MEAGFTFPALYIDIGPSLEQQVQNTRGSAETIYEMTIREHSFNLKGGGGIYFSCLQVSEMDRKKYSESTLCLKKYCFCRKKNNVTTNCREKRFPMRYEAEKNILTPKKTIGPHPLSEMDALLVIKINLSQMG